MNFLKIAICLLFVGSLTIIGCSSEGENKIREAAKQNLPETSAAAATAATATNAGVAHYICANNCEGSGGDAAGTCPVCGTEYTHNQAFHNNSPTAVTGDGEAFPPTGPPPGAPSNPAQNTAGVYHYTCAKGCAGGGAAAGPCSGCGGELAHNADYHNN